MKINFNNFSGLTRGIFEADVSLPGHHEKKEAYAFFARNEKYLGLRLEFCNSRAEVKTIQRQFGLEDYTSLETDKGGDHYLIFDKNDTNYTAAKMAFAVESGFFDTIHISNKGEIKLTKRQAKNFVSVTGLGSKALFEALPDRPVKITSKIFQPIQELFDDKVPAEKKISTLLHHFLYMPWYRKISNESRNPNMLLRQWVELMVEQNKSHVFNGIFDALGEDSPLKTAISAHPFGKDHCGEISFHDGQGTLLDHLRPIDGTPLLRRTEGRSIVAYLEENGAKTKKDIDTQKEYLTGRLTAMYSFLTYTNSTFSFTTRLLGTRLLQVSNQSDAKELESSFRQFALAQPKESYHKKIFSLRVDKAIKRICTRTTERDGWHLVPRKIKLETCMPQKDRGFNYSYRIEARMASGEKPATFEVQVLDTNGAELFCMSLFTRVKVSKELEKLHPHWHIPSSEDKKTIFINATNWIKNLKNKPDALDGNSYVFTDKSISHSTFVDKNGTFLTCVTEALKDDWFFVTPLTADYAVHHKNAYAAAPEQQSQPLEHLLFMQGYVVATINKLSKNLRPASSSSSEGTRLHEIAEENRKAVDTLLSMLRTIYTTTIISVKGKHQRKSYLDLLEKHATSLQKKLSMNEDETSQETMIKEIAMELSKHHDGKWDYQYKESECAVKAALDTARHAITEKKGQCWINSTTFSWGRGDNYDEGSRRAAP